MYTDLTESRVAELSVMEITYLTKALNNLSHLLGEENKILAASLSE